MCSLRYLFASIFLCFYVGIVESAIVVKNRCGTLSMRTAVDFRVGVTKTCFCSASEHLVQMVVSLIILRHLAVRICTPNCLSRYLRQGEFKDVQRLCHEACLKHCCQSRLRLCVRACCSKHSAKWLCGMLLHRRGCCAKDSQQTRKRRNIAVTIGEETASLFTRDQQPNTA